MSFPVKKFQSRKQDYFNWKNNAIKGILDRVLMEEFQSRKQDYFNWKGDRNLKKEFQFFEFQSRKQDYFNWKVINLVTKNG